MHNQILDLLMKRDEITWQSIILDLVKSDDVDPWDIDVSLLSKKYLIAVKKMKEANLFVSGKVLIACALLLKVKSDKLLSEDFTALDNLLFPPEELEELEQFVENDRQSRIMEHPKLTIKTPQARKKKVSVKDLLSALEKALEVDTRRKVRLAERVRIPENLVIPDKKVDISVLIKEVYSKIENFLIKNHTLTFTELVPEGGRDEKIFTFLPLLYLANQEKIDLDQEEHLGEIYIKTVSKKAES